MHTSSLEATRLVVVGDRDDAVYTLRAIDDALAHVAELRRGPIDWRWIATDAPRPALDAALADADAVWLAPGSPYASMDGALHAIRVAREGGIPFLGVCGGFQHAVLEFARDVLGIHDAEHRETSPEARNAVIVPLVCALVGKRAPVFLARESRVATIYGRWRIVERYHCRYGVDPRRRAALEAAGLLVSGTDARGDVRAVELATHPFFVATLFQPQLASRPNDPAPLVRALVDAAIAHRERRAATPSLAAS